MSPLRKVKQRRAKHRHAVEELLEGLIAGGVDEYEGFRQLYGFWCSNNAAVPELRPLLRMDGIVADSVFSVTREFRDQVVAIAKKILPLFSTD